MVRVIAVAVGLTMGYGCVEIDGGAVELSWSIRTFDGESASCDLESADGETDFADIEDVRICWEAVPDSGELSQACDPMLSRRFRCPTEHGVTGFEITPGPTALWIEPVCEVTGLVPPADRYDVPPPIVREIDRGSVVTLNALLIVTSPDACEGGS